MYVNVCRKTAGRSNNARKRTQLPAFGIFSIQFRTAQTHSDLDTRKSVLIIESWQLSTLPKYCCVVQL